MRRGGGRSAITAAQHEGVAARARPRARRPQWSPRRARGSAAGWTAPPRRAHARRRRSRSRSSLPSAAVGRLGRDLDGRGRLVLPETRRRSPRYHQPSGAERATISTTRAASAAFPLVFAIGQDSLSLRVRQRSAPRAPRSPPPCVAQPMERRTAPAPASRAPRAPRARSAAPPAPATPCSRSSRRARSRAGRRSLVEGDDPHPLRGRRRADAQRPARPPSARRSRALERRLARVQRRHPACPDPLYPGQQPRDPRAVLRPRLQVVGVGVRHLRPGRSRRPVPPRSSGATSTPVAHPEPARCPAGRAAPCGR